MGCCYLTHPPSPTPGQTPGSPGGACTSTLSPAASFSSSSGCSSGGAWRLRAGPAGLSCRSCRPCWNLAMAFRSFCLLARITWLLRSRLEALISKMVCGGDTQGLHPLASSSATPPSPAWCALSGIPPNSFPPITCFSQLQREAQRR